VRDSSPQRQFDVYGSLEAVTFCPEMPLPEGIPNDQSVELLKVANQLFLERFTPHDPRATQSLYHRADKPWLEPKRA